jgi:DNA-binding NtrC family response regulator
MNVTTKDIIEVLVVEDEGKMRELLCRAIGGFGFKAEGVKTGEEAMRLMDQNRRDVVVLDLNLPGMGGMDLFEEIRRRWAGTQVVILTGFGDLESAKRAIHLDVVEFLTKPAHLGELELAMDRARRRIKASRGDMMAGDTDKPEKLADLERQHILEVLERNGRNRAATAEALGISLRTLYYRLEEYGE